jgi:hypothetical protein
VACHTTRPRTEWRCDGYKPYGNFQDLLAVVVADRLDADRALVALVENQVTRPAVPPVLASLSDIWVEPPEPDRPNGSSVGEGVGSSYRPATPRIPDYLAMEERNRSLGRAGEELVLRYESERLHSEGLSGLANRIEHVSATKGDGLGYDIVSFEANGRERLIEVKTTSFGKRTPFFVSRNELACSKDRPTEYHLYRVFDFRHNPRLFGLPGPIDVSCWLQPSQFVGRVA